MTGNNPADRHIEKQRRTRPTAGTPSLFHIFCFKESALLSSHFPGIGLHLIADHVNGDGQNNDGADDDVP